MKCPRCGSDLVFIDLYGYRCGSELEGKTYQCPVCVEGGKYQLSRDSGLFYTIFSEPGKLFEGRP